MVTYRGLKTWLTSNRKCAVNLQACELIAALSNTRGQKGPLTRKDRKGLQFLFELLNIYGFKKVNLDPFFVNKRYALLKLKR